MVRKPLAELGIHDYFYFPRGQHNAITDVPGVRVGHETLISGDNVRTGVTVVSPLERYDSDKLVAGGYAYNANGEATGLQYILEEARLISPVVLTNTLSVGDVFAAVIEYYKGSVVLPIVAECWDGYLNDIRGRHVKQEQVFRALDSLSGGPVAQGNVGAGTGMTSFGFKAGIGTASRKVKILDREYTVGILVNNNLGNETGHHRNLRLAGMEVGKILPHPEIDELSIESSDTELSSSIVVIATDIPLAHQQLNRIAKRAVLGMGRVGIASYTDSGDFVIAFSTANKAPRHGSRVIWHMDIVEETLLDDVFEATIEAVEESYLNSLLLAEDMTGFEGHVMKALPIDELLAIMAKTPEYVP
jgi:D-aminopeptidase